MPIVKNSFANSFVTQDATGTPKKSPLTVSTAQVALAVPAGSVRLRIVNSDQPLRVSDTTGFTTTNYFVVPASTQVSIDVAGQSNVYMKKDGATDCTVQFFFEKI